MTNDNNSKLIEKKDIRNLAILTGIALVIGIYLIFTTALISKDGVGYIRRAQQISDDPIGVLKGHYPGFPFIIMASHKIVSLFTENSSIYTWIYSAQSATLFCRLLAIVGLYLIGKMLVGSKDSFMAMLVLVILPYPAFMGSDVIREWPHLLFLAWGFLALLYAARKGVWWLFGVAGVIAGVGHIVRPECVQIVFYGLIWLAIRFWRPAVDFSRKKCILSILILLAGLAIVVAPYANERGKLLPDFIRGLISLSEISGDSVADEGYSEKRYFVAGFVNEDTLKGVAKLSDRLCQNLMYFFVPAVVVGFYMRFKGGGNADRIERVIIQGVILLYFVLMLLLYTKYGYISRRHCLPMVIFTVFYIPAGIRAIAEWLCSKTKNSSEKDASRMAYVLFAVGAAICLPKLLTIRDEKGGYIAAADWLRANSPAGAVVVVPDGRITLYADRKELTLNQLEDFKGEYFLVEIEEGEGEGYDASFWLEEGRKKKRIAISRVTKSD